METCWNLMVGGAKDIDAVPVRTEERPQLENLVVSGEKLRRRGALSAEASDEGCRESEATDRCNTTAERIQRDKRDGPRIATFLDLKDRRGSSGNCPRSLTRTRFGAMAEIGCSIRPTGSWEKSGRPQADLVTTESRHNRRPLAHHPSLEFFWNNVTESALETSCPRTCDWLFCSPCAPQTLKKS